MGCVPIFVGAIAIAIHHHPTHPPPPKKEKNSNWPHNQNHNSSTDRKRRRSESIADASCKSALNRVSEITGYVTINVTVSMVTGTFTSRIDILEFRYHDQLLLGGRSSGYQF